ncbi:hypothetical protein SAMN05216207_10138 [Pseudonocardia ammonioxydans]|uniref:Uncharacterized protein n=1 Tax=Pseudonocardia ammonioxydans TaxID=260086 RepID=A0A1I4Y941_PSUAM|nr:hypothetical protein [Pseudonocardia ammonioxydans]SFN34050.1 hypothetical protein SAMN05216207_10138 [Pseudonocardia ammonioxydans]
MTSAARGAATRPSTAAVVAPWLALAEITMTAPLVIGLRTARLVTGGLFPSARDRREIRRMWVEKADAFSRSAVVAATSVPGPATAAAVLAPIRTRVRGNARRLAGSR